MNHSLKNTFEYTEAEKIITAVESSGDLYSDAVKEAHSRQDELAKPTGSLGELEAISVKLAGITGSVKNDMTKQAVIVMSADNGVVEEGVASAPQSVTLSQTINFTRHFTGVSSLAQYFDIDLLVCDLGVKLDIPSSLYTDKMEFIAGNEKEHGKFAGKIVNRSLARGTANLAAGPAMSHEQALKAFMVGIEAVKAIKDNEYNIFGVGEMGIGNTTTSACVLSALTGASAETVVGRGGGLNDSGLSKKIRIVTDAVGRLKSPEAVTGISVLDILAEVGGFDICAMTGAFVGAAYYRLPVVIDGYISAVAALAASRIAPKSVNFMFGSHQSTEPGYLIAMNTLGIKPFFNLGMRLGEGSGCPISFKIIEAASAAMNGMATFAEGSIDADYLEEGKKGNFF